MTLRRVHARYDAAQTTDENRRHWANADGLGAVEATRENVRQTLRRRARYEVANNCYARGIVSTIANDVVGPGPTLQLLSDDTDLNWDVEYAFETWAAQARLARRLRTMIEARVATGECLALLITNPAIRHPVKLDVRPIEADQVRDPGLALLGDGWVDGVRYDAAGNAREYVIAPFGDDVTTAVDDWPHVDATHVIHSYACDRPGQLRGVPELTPALPLFALMRRWTLATLTAAETAANFAMTIESTAPPEGEAGPELQPMEAVELDRGLGTVLPAGWTLKQVRPEHPGTSHAEFKAELLNEVARCLNVPYNVAAGNSAKYNYASGRLDYQTYFKAIRVRRADAESDILDRVFDAWWSEASRVPGLFPRPLPEIDGVKGIPHQWVWPGHEHVDPLKEAKAQSERLKSGTTTLAAEYARDGKDWEQETRQRAKEHQLLRELDL